MQTSIFGPAPANSFDRRLHLMSKLPADRVARGPGDNRHRGLRRRLRQQQRRQHQRRRTDRRRRRRSAHGRLRHPLSPVRAGQTGRLHRLRHRTDGSDRRKDRPHAGIPGHLVRNDLPRRRPGQVRSRDLGGDDHRQNARRRSTSPTPTTSPNRRSWSKKAAKSPASTTSPARPSAPSRGRPGWNWARKKPTPANSARTPKGPTR